MRTVVIDTSCMIDLHKVDLLDKSLQLPHHFCVPNLLFEREWLRLSAQEKTALREAGLKVMKLSGENTRRADDHFHGPARLSFNDSSALALAESIEESILLTGDGPLRKAGPENGVEVRGVLWVTDELDRNHIVSPQVLYRALLRFRDDRSVYLPRDELAKRIKRYAPKA